MHIHIIYIYTYIVYTYTHTHTHTHTNISVGDSGQTLFANETYFSVKQRAAVDPGAAVGVILGDMCQKIPNTVSKET